MSYGPICTRRPAESIEQLAEDHKLAPVAIVFGPEVDQVSRSGRRCRWSSPSTSSNRCRRRRPARLNEALTLFAPGEAHVPFDVPCTVILIRARCRR